MFQNTSLSAVINPAGWSVWSDSDVNTEFVYFREFKNTGTGASGTRVCYVKVSVVRRFNLTTLHFFRQNFLVSWPQQSPSQRCLDLHTPAGWILHICLKFWCKLHKQCNSGIIPLSFITARCVHVGIYKTSLK